VAATTTTPTYAASAPVFDGPPRNGVAKLTNADTTTAKAVTFAPPAAGTRLNRIRVWSNGTLPGGTTKVAILYNDGSADYEIAAFPMVNNTDVLQFEERFDDWTIPSTASFKVQARTALAASAELHFLFFGTDNQVTP
jgi:hypothetical protein